MEQAVPILFYCLAVVTIAGGIGVLVSRKPARVALSLLVVLTGVTALLLLRSAVALALGQIIVGAAAVGLCMAVGKRSPTGVSSFVHGFAPVAVVVGLAFGAIVAIGAIFGVQAPGQGDGTALTTVNGDPTGNVVAVVRELFTAFLLPLSVVLLTLFAATIGARRMVLGPAEEPRGEGEVEV
ncbi:MAG: NADH-quinone oxidoreductase subunit J [Thermoanaerobaculales bacterium]|nr:NADH-quinone oxidoreductase subunit J [Thermoanaerobaculales bacterium]